MIKEDYVSFETAKLLKEKGFDGILPFIYVDTEKSDREVHLMDILCNYNDGHIKDVISAPTLQMAMKWLREKHKLHIWIANKLKQNKGLPWYYEIHNIETGTVVKIGGVVCGSYEVACETAIKYCLENLI